MGNIKKQAVKVEFLCDLLRIDYVYRANNSTIHKLEPISSFLGQVGWADKGGLPVDELLRRKHLHRAAENKAMVDVANFMAMAREIRSLSRLGGGWSRF